MKKLLIPFLLFSCFVFADNAAQVRDALKKTPVFDGHNDLPWQYREFWKNHLEKVDLRSDTSQLKEQRLHTDIARLKKGGVGAQFWSVYVPVSMSGPEAVHATLEQIDVVHRFTAQYPDAFEMAYTAADVERIQKKGRVASLIGVEGGHSINNSLAVLRQLYGLGARYMTLTHWANTSWADAATQGPVHQGLSEFGKKLVMEMNRLGMLVDLSHVSAETMNDVLDITQAPVIFSHSSARAISKHPRNVPDEVLQRIPQNGGVVMVNFAPSFISEEVRLYDGLKEAETARLKELMPGDPDGAAKALKEWEEKNPRPKATLQQTADHIDHIRKIAGIDSIGLGSDFDGIGATPAGLEDVSKFPDLLTEMMNRGYSKEDIRKISGLNILRAMRKAEEAAAKLKSLAKPDDSLIEEVDKPLPAKPATE